MSNGKPTLRHCCGKASQRAWRRERDWRQIFITGATPENAVEQVRVHCYNTRPAFERMRKRGGGELPFKVVGSSPLKCVGDDRVGSDLCETEVPKRVDAACARPGIAQGIEIDSIETNVSPSASPRGA